MTSTDEARRESEAVHFSIILPTTPYVNLSDKAGSDHTLRAQRVRHKWKCDTAFAVLSKTVKRIVRYPRP